MLKILISNDDGVHAPGLRALYEGLKKLGQVTVVAPLEEKSTTGHSLTLHKPLRVLRTGSKKDPFYGVSGSPADCIFMGIKQILKCTPDLVVSGINRGANLGQDTHYSGTVSAAREACIVGIPSIAVSLCFNFKANLSEDDLHFKTAAEWTCQMIKRIPLHAYPKHTLLNLNVPNLPMKRVKGLVLGRQGFQIYSGSIIKRKDHRGRDYFWIGGTYRGYQKSKDTDCDLIGQNYASVTPIKVDVTDFEFMSKLSKAYGGKGRNQFRIL